MRRIRWRRHSRWESVIARPARAEATPSGTGDVKASFPLLRRRVLRPDPSNAGMWAIVAGHAVTHAYAAALYLLLPFIAKHLGLTYSQIGFLLAVRQFMSTVVNLPAGIIVDTLGRRNMFMGISLLGMAVPYLAISATSAFWVLALCMALLGVASFLWHPAAITSISEMYPASRGYGLAIHELGANLGDTLMPLLTGVLLGYLTWRQVMSATVAAGVVLGVIALQTVIRVRRRVEPAANAPPAAGYLTGLRTLLRNTNLMILALVSGIRSFTQKGLQSFLPLYLVNDLKISAVVVGFYIAVVQVSGIVATPIAGTLSDRICGDRPPRETSPRDERCIERNPPRGRDRPGPDGSTHGAPSSGCRV